MQVQSYYSVDSYTFINRTYIIWLRGNGIRLTVVQNSNLH